MINQLQKIFKSLLIYKEGVRNLDPEYKWFSTENHEVIGIHKEELTAKDTSLLEAFLSPYNIKFPVLTEEEERWRALIHSGEVDEKFIIDAPYRFVYFSMKKNQTSPSQFKAVIQEFFEKRVSILWENGHEGILIEQQTKEEDRISFEQIIDILMSDLYVRINFFVGFFKEDLEDVHSYYQAIVQAAQIAIRYSNKSVTNYVEAVPYLFIDQMEEASRLAIGETVLKEYASDEDTLKMIETFVACNLNVSETSKELHMHRNSLQYRLDRFYEKTSIDIRQFHQAMTVYLALLARK